MTDVVGVDVGGSKILAGVVDASGDVLKVVGAKTPGRRNLPHVVEDAIVDAVQPLRFRGNDLIVFHVLDPTELEFGFSDAQPFEDLESGEQMPVVPEAFREEYRSLVKAHIDALTQAFSAVRVDYTLLDKARQELGMKK